MDKEENEEKVEKAVDEYLKAVRSPSHADPAIKNLQSNFAALVVRFEELAIRLAKLEEKVDEPFSSQ